MEDMQFMLVLVLTFAGYAALVASVLIKRIGMHIYHMCKRKNVLEKNENCTAEACEAFPQQSNFQHQGNSYRRRFQVLLTSSLPGFLWQMLQLLITIMSCGTYIAVLYEESHVSTTLLAMDASMTVFFTLDLIFHFYASSDRLHHLVLSPYALVDWMTIVPFFVSWAFGDPFNTNNDNQLFIRSLRLFRSLRIVRCYRLLPQCNNNIVQAIVEVAMSFFILIFIAVSLIQFIEDNLDPIPGLLSNSPFEWFDAFYYIIVTFSTVGYGDITPHTYAGRGVMIFFILFGIALLPHQIGQLINAIRLFNKYEYTRYHPRKHVDYLLVLGTLDARVLTSLFEEWYHRCHSTRDKIKSVNLVLVAPEPPTKAIRNVKLNGMIAFWQYFHWFLLDTFAMPTYRFMISCK